MKLLLGERLKECRVRSGITQEAFAEVLGVSAQSVSRWELGICYPDMELLPTIANYFDVTIDMLLGMEDLRGEDRRREIFTKALEYEKNGAWRSAEEMLRKALLTYPADDGMRTELALVLSKTNEPGDRAEAIGLLEAVLAHCANEKIRCTARASLCFLYKAEGCTEKSMLMGRVLPHIWESREILMPFLVAEVERSDALFRSVNISYQVLRDLVKQREVPFSLGYKCEETIDTAEFCKSLYE